MCLNGEFNLIPYNNAVGYGWKIFMKQRNRQLNFSYYLYNGNSIAPVNKWLKTNPNEKIMSSTGEKYPGGFHIYTNLNNARRICNSLGTIDAVIRKVKYKGIKVIGEEDEEDGHIVIIVAREMLILSRCEVPI
jgi:hypothetical protein